MNEMLDLDAWFDYLRGRDDVDPTRIAMLGNSLGGTLAIQYAAGNIGIRAVVANSAFSSIGDTVETSVRFFTGLPAFPFAPLIVFWAEREAGFEADEVDAKRWIAQISPRPVLLMQGGKDSVISNDSGQLLFAAAGEPKELWFDPDIRHAGFDQAKPGEYERRVVGFFDRYVK
jgi:dienelactone hydrolase